MRAAIVVACAAFGCGRSTTTPPPSTEAVRDAAAATAPVIGPPLRVRKDNVAWDPATTFDHGIAFLASDYSPTSLFDDPYITNCSAPKSGCTTEYRELDHAILELYWVPTSVSQDPKLVNVSRHARRVFAHWFEQWRNAPLDREALDLYALFPYYLHDASTAHMVDELVKGLDTHGDWEAYDAHGDAYRKMTDELWPIIALARNHVADDVLARALDRKQQEAQRVLTGDWKTWPSTERFYVLTHIYLAFLWTERAGHDIGPYWPLLETIEHQLAGVIDDPELSLANVALSQALFALSEGGYPDRKVLVELAAEVAARQQPNGRWNPYEVAIGKPIPGRRAKLMQEGFATAHATLMALAGLGRWATWQAAAAQREWRLLAGPNPITRLSTATPPETVFKDVGGEHVKVGFPVVKQADIDFLDEIRMEPENAVLFFHAAELTGRKLEIFHAAVALHPSSHGIALHDGHLAVELELYGPAATPEFADRVKHGIESVWRGTVAGAPLSTTVHVTVRSETAHASATGLQVFVPNSHVMPSTQREGDTGDRPTTWPPWINERTIAHEMGHLFGFPDGYHVEVRDGFYYLVYDHPDDLMSSPYGAVQPGQLAELARAYRPHT
jgi:hypothetical protein